MLRPICLLFLGAQRYVHEDESKEWRTYYQEGNKRSSAILWILLALRARVVRNKRISGHRSSSWTQHFFSQTHSINSQQFTFLFHGCWLGHGSVEEEWKRCKLCPAPNKLSSEWMGAGQDISSMTSLFILFLLSAVSFLLVWADRIRKRREKSINGRTYLHFHDPFLTNRPLIERNLFLFLFIQPRARGRR